MPFADNNGKPDFQKRITPNRIAPKESPLSSGMGLFDLQSAATYLQYRLLMTFSRLISFVFL